jgi:phage-related baseplate assembly protein
MGEVPGMTDIVDPAALVALSVIEPVDIEADLTARMAKFKELWAANDPPLGLQYDVGNTEFDPIRINQQVNSYFAAMLRSRINMAIRATSPFTASGSDIDTAATRMNVYIKRLPGESDERYRSRIALGQAAPAPGSEEGYRLAAMTAEPTLSDVSAIDERPNPDDPTVVVTLLSERDEMVPTDPEIARARAAIFSNRTRRLSDTIYVRTPNVIDTDYVVQIWLYPSADAADVISAIYKPASETTPASGTLVDLVAAQRRLGADHTLSAIYSAARVPGVQNAHVLSPVADIAASPREVVRVNSITVVQMGLAE